MRNSEEVCYSIYMRKRKDNLIPLEKSRKVIYLERRGRERKRTSIGAAFFGILGVLCLLYCLGMGLFVNTGTGFFMIWAVAAVVCGVVSAFLAHEAWRKRIPAWVRKAVLLLFVAGLVLFVSVEGMILSCFSAKPKPGADVCIILGAQIKESGPSDVLQRRLDKAIDYLRENPETVVIVSGGQGANEPVSEAQGMQEYLTAAGIAPERILQEVTSSNTCENLRYSGKLIDRTENRVVVVTNNFHMFRSLAIAKKQGYCMVEGLSASTFPGSLPNNLLREFLGVIKDFLVGNM